MKKIRLGGAIAGAGAVLAVTAVYAQPSVADTQFTVTATTTTSTFAIPCSTCVLHSTPEDAHTGGTGYDAGSIKDVAGHVTGHFVIEETGMTPFNDGLGEVQLVGTIVLGHSQLTFQGIEEPPLDGGVVAITGGTGRFAGARGEITYADLSDTITRLTIRLR